MDRKTFWVIVSLGLLAFVPNPMFADEISITLSSGSCKMEKGAASRASFVIDGFTARGEAGNPALPEKTYAVALPPDVVPGSVRLAVTGVESETLPGAYDVPPAAPDMAWAGDGLIEDWGAARDVRNGKNVGVYGKDALWPPAPVALGTYSQMRKWKFVWVKFSPVQYNPVRQRVTLTKSAKVKISFKRSDSQSDRRLLRADSSDKKAQEMFVNYDEAKAWYDAGHTQDLSQATYDYVIITTNAIESNSAKLSSFVTHKQSLGYSVLVVTEDDFGSLVGQSPNHRAEKIRQWLINNYATYGIEYVLLIGDPSPYESGEGDIPMKMCWPRRFAGSDEDSPTDCFFADLTGNWDLDGDGYYGEWSDYTGVGGVDFSVEVWVGRIPVYAAAYGTLDNILQKTMDYENESGVSWRKSVLLPMGFQDVGYDGAPLGEQAKDDYLTARGYSYWRQYQQGSGACSLNSIYPSEEELRGGTVVRDRWAGTDYGIVMWWGHGSDTSAAVGYGGCWDGTLFSNTQTSSLDDDHPSFTYQCSCTNGYPEVTNNLQYSILIQGGIGTVSATRVSWFNTGVGYGEFDGSSTNSGIGYEYASRLTQELEAGEALYAAKFAVVPDISMTTRLMNQYDFNLYGDPSVSIAGPPTPTPTPVPPLVIDPGPLAAGQPFSVAIALNENIGWLFDYYMFVDTPVGIYTIYLDGRIQKGLTALYRNVPGFNAPFSTTVNPPVRIPAGMQGQTVTFYAVVVNAGKLPPVSKPSDLTPSTQYVIYLGKDAAVVN
ncbi:MAG: C25 family cysteine peptidase [bacterium]